MDKYEIAQLQSRVEHSNKIRNLPKMEFLFSEVVNTKEQFIKNLDEVCDHLSSLGDDVVEFFIEFLIEDKKDPYDEHNLSLILSRFNGSKEFCFVDDCGWKVETKDVVHKLLKNDITWGDFYTTLIDAINYL